MPNICHCGKPSDGWPDEKGEDRLCQRCWEKKCSQSWWQTIKALGQAESNTQQRSEDAAISERC